MIVKRIGIPLRFSIVTVQNLGKKQIKICKRSNFRVFSEVKLVGRRERECKKNKQSGNEDTFGDVLIELMHIS